MLSLILPNGGGGGGSSAWGGITGTLSAQTDLQAALDAKLSLAGGTMTGALTIASGTLTDSAPSQTITQIWNDAADAFIAAETAVTNTASIGPSIGDSYLHRYKVNGSVVGGFVNFYNALAVRCNSVQLGSRFNGIYEQNSGTWNLMANDVIMTSIYSNEMRLAAASALTWKIDSAPYTGSASTKLAQVSAGLLKIVDGSDVLAGLQLGATSSALYVGTHAALSGESVTGYITIKDSGGTERKIAVVS